MGRRPTTLIAVGLAVLVLPATAAALPGIDISIGSTENPDKLVTGLKLLGLFTILAIAPAILMTMTSFTRIIIVFSFLRQAVGTQQAPPNQVMIGLALFLTVYVMAPVGVRINEEAITPYKEGKVSDGEALDLAIAPMRAFMLNYTREKDLTLFYEITGMPLPSNAEDVSLKTLVPAFVISELKTAFQMGFMLFVPFIVLDIAIASMLMSMGMIMLPPALISLPLKLMLFVLVDGWNLVVGSVLRSFQVM
ncbi:MAG: flagellar type III secretion system pore protein FliP [Proteobacteria bacterium]|nr:flagellar type III secretion system pore protein FliP [Pseudomonadota bacterium]